jgi:hypothetical protein
MLGLYFTKCGNLLAKTADLRINIASKSHTHPSHSHSPLSVEIIEILRINLNLDRVPITSKSHTHPSHSHSPLSVEIKEIFWSRLQ